MNVQVEADLASGAAPELLVPGDVAGYRLVAQTLRGHARLLEGTGDCLSRIEVTNWRGQASTGFLHVIAVEPGRWRTAADAFTAAADTLAKHQGKTDKQLKDRLRSDPVVRASSSFTSTHDAERFTEMVLAAKRAEIGAWLESGRPRAGFSLDVAQTVGRGLQRGEAIRDMTQVRVVLVADGRYQDGYRVFTSYPTGP